MTPRHQLPNHQLVISALQTDPEQLVSGWFQQEFVGEMESLLFVVLLEITSEIRYNAKMKMYIKNFGSACSVNLYQLYS